MVDERVQQAQDATKQDPTREVDKYIDLELKDKCIQLLLKQQVTRSLDQRIVEGDTVTQFATRQSFSVLEF